MDGDLVEEGTSPTHKVLFGPLPISTQLVIDDVCYKYYSNGILLLWWNANAQFLITSHTQNNNLNHLTIIKYTI